MTTCRVLHAVTTRWQPYSHSLYAGSIHSMVHLSCRCRRGGDGRGSGLG